MTEQQHRIIPGMASLEFAYNGESVCSIPWFVLFGMLPERDRSNGMGEQLEKGIHMIASGEDLYYSLEECVRFFQVKISWSDLCPQLSCPKYFLESYQHLWESRERTQGLFEIRLVPVQYPDIAYRYFGPREDWATQLLHEGRLFLPNPSLFNDPFDCGLEDPVRLKFIEAAMGCFSREKSNVLMFSHYAENHSGFAVGFDTGLLLQSLAENNPPWDASLRPVWYLREAPRLSLQTEPALCATCKNDIWLYENEFRLFLSQGSDQLAPSGHYLFDRNAIREVIIGCKATDLTISACKMHTNDLQNCKCFKAFQQPNAFSLGYHEIP